MPCLNLESPRSELTALPTVLDRVGAELETLAACVDTLQDTLGPVLLQGVQGKPQAMVQIQRLDSLAQTLASLSGFMQALGRSGVVGKPVDIGPLLDALTLSDLADRLRGHAMLDVAEDFELF